MPGWVVWRFYAENNRQSSKRFKFIKKKKKADVKRLAGHGSVTKHQPPKIRRSLPDCSADRGTKGKGLEMERHMLFLNELRRSGGHSISIKFIRREVVVSSYASLV